MTILTALEVAQTICEELSLGTPNDLVGSNDKTVKQIKALMNKEGRKLSGRWAWQVMTWEVTFVTNGTEDQGSILTMADAIDQTWRYVLDDTMWNRTRRLPVIGPLSPWDYQAAKAFNITGPYTSYRIDKNRIILHPAPPIGETIAFELVSRSWVTNQEGAYKERIDQNDDLIVLDTDLVIAGVVWRWLKKKGLDYAEEFAEYERDVDDAIARDKTARTLKADGPSRVLLPVAVASPGDWPVTLKID